MTGSQRNHFNMPAPTLHFGCTDNCIHSIVAALRNDIRAQRLDELEWSVFAEEDNPINRLKSSQHISALSFAPDGPALAFEPFHGCISVEADDQCITEPTRLGQDIHVTRMEEIEYSIRENNFPGLAGSPPDKLAEPGDFPRGIERRQKLASALGRKRTFRGPRRGTVTLCV
jgi:hypothetical protein